MRETQLMRECSFMYMPPPFSCSSFYSPVGCAMCRRSVGKVTHGTNLNIFSSFLLLLTM